MNEGNNAMPGNAKTPLQIQIAKWPPVKPEIRHDDKSRDRESEQVREIQRRERSERRYPPRDAVIRKPAQARVQARGILLRDSIEIQESFQKKHVAGDQQRQRAVRVIARIHLLKKKPGRGSSARAQRLRNTRPAVSMVNNRPRKASEASIPR